MSTFTYACGHPGDTTGHDPDAEIEFLAQYSCSACIERSGTLHPTYQEGAEDPGERPQLTATQRQTLDEAGFATITTEDGREVWVFSGERARRLRAQVRHVKEQLDVLDSSDWAARSRLEASVDELRKLLPGGEL